MSSSTPAPVAPAAPAPSREFWSGCRDELPILVGVAPFGVIYGVLALGAGLPAFTAQAMSSIVFAGSAQFVSSQLIQQGVPSVVLIVTVFVVNLRHALYSASVAPRIRHLGAGWKAGLAYLLTDECYAVVATRYAAEGDGPDVSPNRHWYFLGAGLTLWASWQLSTAVGVLLGEGAREIIPPSLSLDFTLALTFIALVFPSLKDGAATAAALAAGAISVLAFGLPHRLGLVVAALVGIFVGLFWEARRK